MSAIGPSLRSALWWLVPALLLALAVGWETEWGVALRTPAPPAAPIEPKPVETALLPEYAIAGGVAARPETVQRTLFNPTRRPAPAAAQEGGETRMQRGQFALTGTTLADGKSIALLREIAANKTRRVQQGDFINGMLVSQVGPDRIRLALGDEFEELVLKVATNPRPTTVAVAPPPAAVPPVAQPPAVQPVATPRPTQQGVTVQREAAQTLAERRRAARAAAAARAGAGADAGQPAAAPTTPGGATGGTEGSGPGGGRTFDDVFQRYQQRSRSATQQK